MADGQVVGALDDTDMCDMAQRIVDPSICPEGKGWSDLRDVSGRFERVTGFLRVTRMRQ